MSHKQYKYWILDDSPLNAEEKRLLQAHLAACGDCRKLKKGWEKSLHAIHATEQKNPTPDFSVRWQAKLQQEKKRNRIVRQRVIIFSSLLLIGLALIAYVILSGSLTAFLAHMITSSTQILLFLTKGFSELASLINGVPSIVRWALGVFFIGVANMFVILLSYLVWKARKNHKEWQRAGVYAEE